MSGQVQGASLYCWRCWKTVMWGDQIVEKCIFTMLPSINWKWTEDAGSSCCLYRIYDNDWDLTTWLNNTEIIRASTIWWFGASFHGLVGVWVVRCLWYKNNRPICTNYPKPWSQSTLGGGITSCFKWSWWLSVLWCNNLNNGILDQTSLCLACQ